MTPSPKSKLLLNMTCDEKDTKFIQLLKLYRKFDQYCLRSWVQLAISSIDKKPNDFTILPFAGHDTELFHETIKIVGARMIPYKIEIKVIEHILFEREVLGVYKHD